MNFISQKDLESLILKYNNTDSSVIKKNIIRLIDDSEYRRNNQLLADKVGLKVQTIYLYRQIQKKTNISFEIALKLANALRVSVEELIK
jgi:transcriptional regulator with XRE-family HTH domain